jgi:hypothetical protein
LYQIGNGIFIDTASGNVDPIVFDLFPGTDGNEKIKELKAFFEMNKIDCRSGRWNENEGFQESQDE